MRKFIFAITFFAATLSGALQASLAGLTHNYHIIKKFDSRPIYHMRSITDMGGLNCGYFCLWNAKELERRLGMGSNGMSSFKSSCYQYLGTCGKSSSAGASNIDLIYLADNYLGVHNLYPLVLNHGTIHPMIAKEKVSWTLSTAVRKISSDVKIKRHEIQITITAPYKTSESVIKQAAKEAKYKHLNSFMRSLKNKIVGSSYAKQGVAHFICGFNNHWILVSVVKVPGEQPALFVFDNLNNRIIPGSSAMNYINQIYRLFVS